MTNLKIRHIILLFFVIALGFQSLAQSSYCEYYDCDKAIQFHKKHKNLFDSIGQLYQYNPTVLFSIVAPEVAYFSQYQDEIETAAAEYLYVKSGSQYGNFSLGIFQMKPSFIEKMEREVIKNNYKDFIFLTQYESGDSVLIRRERVRRIRDVKWSVYYIALFCKIMDKKFEVNTFAELTNQVKFYATGYNRGFHVSEKEIYKWYKIKSFPNCLLCFTKYNYGSIANEIYHKLN